MHRSHAELCFDESHQKKSTFSKASQREVLVCDRYTRRKEKQAQKDTRKDVLFYGTELLIMFTYLKVHVGARFCVCSPHGRCQEEIIDF